MAFNNGVMHSVHIQTSPLLLAFAQGVNALLCARAAGLGERKQNCTYSARRSYNADRFSSEKRKSFLPNNYIHKFWMSIKRCSSTLNIFQTECFFPECASHINISKTP